MLHHAIAVHGIDAAAVRQLLHHPHAYPSSRYQSCIHVPSLTMKGKDDRDRRPSRRQSAFSIASSLFGPTALGDDVDFDRQISPALQTSHVFFESPFDDSSPFALSDVHVTANGSSPGASPTLAAVSGGLQPLTPSGSSLSGTTTPSKQSHTAGEVPRKSSIASLFTRMRDLPKRILRKSSSSDASTPSSSTVPLNPPPLRSTCTITAEQLAPPDPSNRPLTRAEKDAIRRRKSAEKYIKRKSKKRLRAYRREQKRTQKKLSSAAMAGRPVPTITPRTSRTGRLLTAVDGAKEKFWEWMDRRDADRRRRDTREYSRLRDERHRDVQLVPVDREYEVVERRAADVVPNVS
ncbi:hypothetical protein Dda_8699 [Drechslerella dactyloides]|uniref:Uncharacterized protein n=1 Tax=Drechslerella dactyloides TaxID=74499 RepID=A0AAD6IU89_DREDA|nr:hypothetical protein Dda_8699 [Drechslerella dactyloides]